MEFVTAPEPTGASVRLRPEIAALPAYRQGRPAPADGYKLSSNENPFDPLPSVIAAVSEAVTAVRAIRGPQVGGFANAVLRKIAAEPRPRAPADRL